MYTIIGIVAFLILAPFLGGLLSGIDRKISARMQGRIGPSIFQPFYDVQKLFSKQFIVVNFAQIFLVVSFLATVIFTDVCSSVEVIFCFASSYFPQQLHSLFSQHVSLTHHTATLVLLVSYSRCFATNQPYFLHVSVFI